MAVRLLDLFMPGPDRYQAAFPPQLHAELEGLVDYRRLADRQAEAVENPRYEEELYSAEIIMTGWGAPRLPADLAQRGRLRYVCHVTGEMRRLVPRELIEAGVIVSNWGDSISRTIAEASLMMILGCLRRVKTVQDEIHLRGGYYPPARAQSLFERKVGLYGFGAIARDLVPLLKPFNVEIYVYSPSVPQSLIDEYGVKRVNDLATLFSTCDIVSIHAAKTPATIGSVNREMLRLLPDDGVVVNTSRGAVVDEADLAAEVKSGRLWVALDVYEREPLPVDSPLRGEERVLLFRTPEGRRDRYPDMGRHAIDNIRRFLAGEPVVPTIDLGAYDRMT